MKKFILFLLLLTMLSLPHSSAEATAVSEIEVTHFFTHALVAYPEIAFAKNNEMRSAYDRDCITVTEYKRFLQALYDKDYMLVDINDVYESNENKPAIKKDFKFPKGKKPLILSFDDINFYRKKMNLGMNDKLVLGENGQLATFTANAKQQINYDNETVTVLENFIKSHPDFSFNNAKGLLCLTGFDGILGYRTESGSTNRLSEIENVKPLISKLKELNWKFACHSYGHYRMTNINSQKFIKDTEKWINEVQPLVGKTDIYCYPYGNWEITTNNNISDKHKYLVNSGFNLFLGVGDETFFNYIPYGEKGKYTALFMDRRPVDGISLRFLKKSYSKYFDTTEIYDNTQRFIKI